MARKKAIFIFSLLAAVALSGFIGYLFGNRNFVLGENFVPELVKSDLGHPKDVDFSLFWEAYRKLKDSYPEEIDAQEYLYGAISGAFASLGDPYTIFLPPELSEEFRKELSGELEGIGIKIGILDGLPAVIAPLESSPAKHAGLRPRDRIIKVDGEETKDLYLDEIVAKIRGKEGTIVKLEVAREGEEELREFEIKRAKLEVKTVEVTYDGDVAIIAMHEFGLNSKSDFMKVADEIVAKGIGKIILDLRNNPGGILDGAVDVAGEIFPRGEVVVIEESRSGRRELKAAGRGTLKQVDLVVLVNQGSASAAEIVAGSVRDHGRGKVIGEKTFGKGTVQQLEILSDGSSVKITVSKWLTPQGGNIEKEGISPDIEMEEDDDRLFNSSDPLIKRAMEELAD